MSLLTCLWLFCLVFFFKQKTAYEMRISDWSSDVCSSDLGKQPVGFGRGALDFLQDAAGLRRDRVVQRVQVADAVHAAEIEQNLRTALIRRRRGAHAGDRKSVV